LVISTARYADTEPVDFSDWTEVVDALHPQDAAEAYAWDQCLEGAEVEVWVLTSMDSVPVKYEVSDSAKKGEVVAFVRTSSWSSSRS
jgi:hypothetical protein